MHAFNLFELNISQLFKIYNLKITNFNNNFTCNLNVYIFYFKLIPAVTRTQRFILE